jgi:hypothetical protein
MKNRNGDIYLQMKKMNGDLSALEQNEKSSQMKSERAGGNYGGGGTFTTSLFAVKTPIDDGRYGPCNQSD